MMCYQVVATVGAITNIFFVSKLFYFLESKLFYFLEKRFFSMEFLVLVMEVSVTNSRHGFEDFFDKHYR